MYGFKRVGCLKPVHSFWSTVGLGLRRSGALGLKALGSPRLSLSSWLCIVLHWY